MWAYESAFYQIYPLGFCGAPFENDGQQEHRLLKVIDWIPHLKKLGMDCVLFNPVFESDTHGYNTRDFRKIDVRLGTNEDFKRICDTLHQEKIRVVLDGVFNHVGRGFWAFQDVLKNREGSPYKDWFHLQFGGNNGFNDGLWYEGWEGNYDLVKLNLQNPRVTDYLMETIKGWIDEFDIDGLRLDVAYLVDQNFIRRIRSETSNWKQDFFLVGEMIGGDYHRIMGPDLCHSATNYECYKGLYSAFNSDNLFEIVHSLKRQFGPEPWTLYKGEHLLSFVDNHDVSRIASLLNVPQLLPALYLLMFAMPGIPTGYYGSEWGVKGDKKEGDPALRPCFDQPEWNALTDAIAGCARAVHASKAVCYGDFHELVLKNKQCVLERCFEDDRIMIAINLENTECRLDFNANAGRAHDLVTGETIDFGGGLKIPPYTGYLLQPY